MRPLNELVRTAFGFKPWPKKSDWLPRLQSHRGFWVDGARENTLASLAQAKEKHYEMVEIDVRLSLDGIPVLSHDGNLQRLAGVNKIFSKMTAQELAGYEFPTLEEVLKTKNRPGKINIEVKNAELRNFQLEEKIIEVIRITKKFEEVLISSFNPFSLRPFAKALPDVPRALLIERDPIFSLSYLRTAGCLIAQPHMINWPYQLLNRPLVEFLKDRGVPVAVWTVNDYRLAKELFSWGVDTVITDRIVPEKLV